MAESMGRGDRAEESDSGGSTGQGQRLGNAPDNVVYELGEEEKVGCFYCMADGCHQSYGRGEAYLAGPGHKPWDGSSHFICTSHLDKNAVIG